MTEGVSATKLILGRRCIAASLVDLKYSEGDQQQLSAGQTVPGIGVLRLEACKYFSAIGGSGCAAVTVMHLRARARVRAY